MSRLAYPGGLSERFQIDYNGNARVAKGKNDPCKRLETFVKFTVIERLLFALHICISERDIC